MPDLLYGDPDNFTCYGSTADNTFDELFEDTRPFGRGAKNFTFEGWNGTDTASERDVLFSDTTLDVVSWREIPAPAFSVVLPNKDGAEAKRMVDYIIDNKYIDLHTKVVLVDLFVYNVQLNSMCAIRITAQFTKAGGVLPSYKSRMVSLAPFPFGPGTDDLHSRYACY